MSEKIIYRLNDDISFRKCSLYDEDNGSGHGDCTNFTKKNGFFSSQYFCNQEGVHFHCTKHPEIELEYESDTIFTKLFCPKCRNSIEVGNYKELRSRCLRALNRETFKDAKFVRLDDWYIPEVKEKVKTASDYWVTVNVKTDKEGNTIVVLYVGYKGSGDKVQFFIKPEKGQLSSDHKDLDPAKILSKIEVTLKDRLLSQEYDV